MRRYHALCEEWTKRPPTRWMKAAQLGYRHRRPPPVADMPKLKPTSPTSPEVLQRRREIILAARARGEPTVQLPEEEAAAAADGPAPTSGLGEYLRRHGEWRG
jgi:hypothetical protein